jgi:hypothetical protein
MGCAGAVGARGCRYGVDGFPVLRQGNLPCLSDPPHPRPPSKLSPLSGSQVDHSFDFAPHGTPLARTIASFVRSLPYQANAASHHHPAAPHHECRHKQSTPTRLSFSLRGIARTRSSLISTIRLRKPFAALMATGDDVHCMLHVSREVPSAGASQPPVRPSAESLRECTGISMITALSQSGTCRSSGIRNQR